MRPRFDFSFEDRTILADRPDFFNRSTSRTTISAHVPFFLSVKYRLLLLVASIEACKKNIQFNGAIASAKVEAHLADARVYMLNHPKEFDVVDLDPYGSPSVFLDLAV